MDRDTLDRLKQAMLAAEEAVSHADDFDDMDARWGGLGGRD